MANQKLQIGITVENAAKDDAENMDGSFDVPAPACSSQLGRNFRSEIPCIGDLDYRRWRWRWVQIDWNLKSFCSL